MFRRNFFKNALAITALPSLLRSTEFPEFFINSDPSIPQADLTKFVTNPVIARSIELLKRDGLEENKAWFVRITTDDLAYTIPANSRIPYLRGIFNGLVAPFFIGKDLRHIETLTEACYRDERNYKYCGMPLWNCIGHIENAALGLLGTLAQKSVAEMYGAIQNRQIKVYYTTFDRKSTPETYCEQAVAKALSLGVEAIKVKIGGRMGPDPVPARTKAIIPLFRKALGDKFTIYADANGSYDNLTDILDIGRRLEDAGYAIWEEPCAFREYELTRQATKKLKIKIAGGEQDTSYQIWRRMINERVVDVVQPDLMYPGGFTRALRIARMAHAAGLQIGPHSPRIGHNQAPMLHLAAITPNMTPFQEWQPNDFLKDFYAPNLVADKGIVQLPLGTGWGVSFDSDFEKSLRVVEGY